MKKILLFIAFFTAATIRLWAVNPVPYTEGMGFSFKIIGNTGGSGTAIMTVYDEVGTQQKLANWASGPAVESDMGMAMLRPGKTYEVNFWGYGPTEYWMSFNAPIGYDVYVNGVATDLVSRSTSGGWYLHYYTVELRPAGSAGGGDWGSFSGIALGQSISWEVGLGNLRTGRGAGSIVFKELNLSNNPTSRDRLYYVAPPSNVGQIVVVRDGPSNQTLRQICTPIGFTDIVDETTGTPAQPDGYTIKFYSWGDLDTPGWNGTVYLFKSTATPWKTIRVKSPGADQLKITESEGTSSPRVRVSELVGTGGTAPSGGTITTNGSYRVHTFSSPGNDTFTPSGILTGVNYLVVGGGGGGGDAVTQHFSGGGGGGGAVSYITGASFSPGVGKTVTVGAGGSHGANGGNSSFNSTTAYGGGHGQSSNAAPTSGGSGGGGGANQAGAVAGSGSNVYAGGFGDNGGHAWEGGGGGGAGGAGGGITTSGNFNGGSGAAYAISGTSTYYGGGGGGGTGNAYVPTYGGAGGGGGNAAGQTGASGAANTGGGGGGAGYDNLSGIPYNGGSGGSGVVIISYPIVGSGDYAWTLQEGDGTTVLRTTTHTNTITAIGERNNIVEVRTGGASGTIVAKTKYHYVTQAWGAEELMEVTADPDSSNPEERTTAYAYYTSSADKGNYRKVKSITEPTGNWTAYKYYDDWERRGRVQYQFQPWLNTPATASVSTTSGRVIHFDYAADWTGRYTRPTLREESIERSGSMVPTGKTEWTHGDITGSGQPRAHATIKSYRDGTNFQSDYTETYRADADPDLAGLPYVVKPADLTQTSISISRGTFDPSATPSPTFTVGSSGDHWRELRFNGTTSTSGTDVVTAFDGQNCESVRMVPNKSTVNVTIRIAQGYVYRTETHVYTGGGNFSLITSEGFTYDGYGHLTQRWASNGALTNNAYTNGQLTSTIDPAGTETQFNYDLLGRITRQTKLGASSLTVGSNTHEAQDPIYTHYVYDGANHVVETVVTPSATKPSTYGSTDIGESREYELAGRLKKSIAPGGYTTDYEYLNDGRTLKVKLPVMPTSVRPEKITEVYLDGQLKQVSGDAVVAEAHDYLIESTGRRIRQSYFGGISGGWTKSYADWLGRQVQVEQPAWGSGVMSRQWYYNDKGQLWKFTQPGVAATLYEYDNLGLLAREGLDIGDTPGTLDDSSDDRIKRHTQAFYLDTNWYLERKTYTFASSGSSTEKLLSRSYEILTGLPSNRLSETEYYDIYGNITTVYTTVDRAGKKVVTTTNAPDSDTDAVQIVHNGLTVQASDTAGIAIRQTYDALGRPSKTIDPRTTDSTLRGTVTAYLPGTNQVSTVTDPADVVQATYAYDTTGRVKQVTNALGSTYCEYYPNGQKKREWGDTTYPVEYVYDELGRVKQQKTFRGGTGWTTATWPASPGTVDWTYWVYDEPTGLLKEKYDAANLGATTGLPIADAKKVSYTYTAAGQLYTREWARVITPTSPRVKATYAYSSTTGELTSVIYNDGTPNLAYTYNRLGQTLTVTDATADSTNPRTFNYNLGGTLALQSEVLGTDDVHFYGNRLLSYGYETSTAGALGRPTSLKLGSSADDDLYQATTYGYALDGRLNSIGAAGQTFAYTYTANSHLIANIENSALGYKDARTYHSQHDWLAARETTWGTSSTKTRAKFTYTQDTLGRVKDVAKSGTMFDHYGTGNAGLKTFYTYNDRSELYQETTKLDTASTLTTGTVLTGREDAYTYDSLGNRATTTHNTSEATYTPNSRNGYATRTGYNRLDVAGARDPAQSVLVSGATAAVQGSSFFQGFKVARATDPSFVTLLLGQPTSAKSLDGIVSFNDVGKSISALSATLPTGASGTVKQFGGSPNIVGINQTDHGYTFSNGKVYTFGFWARTTSGTRSINPVLTDNSSTGGTPVTYTLSIDWQWITVDQSYTAVGANPRAYYCLSLSGGDFQVYGAVIYEKTVGLTYAQEAFVAPLATTFQYDDDGNLTMDDRWSYTYDAENRLIQMRTLKDAVGTAPLLPEARAQKLVFTYDYLGRRVQKSIYEGYNRTADTFSSTAVVQTRFVYSGWNCIATLNAVSGNAVIADYYWGLDLSGTDQGAGGIGGLLLVKEGANSFLPAYDAMGNVHAMITAAAATIGGTSYAAGDIVAAYEYDAFGTTLRESGKYAGLNPFRFATKYTDIETGLVYHDTRYYSPSLGRFINRDSAGEQGGLNLYAYVSNRVPNAWDYLGMDTFLEFGGYNSDGGLIWNDGGDYTSMPRPDHNDLVPGLNDYDVDTGLYTASSDMIPRAYMQSWSISNGWRSGDVADQVAAYLEAREAMWKENGVEWDSDDSDAASEDAPNNAGSAGTASGRSGLGNALRHIPILGGILGGVGDVVSGIGNTALGVVSLGQSGTLGRGVGQIASGTLSTVGNVWAMPNTAVGLVYGAVGLPFGAKPVWDSNDAILRFTNMPGWLMPSAMSLGHVQVYGPGTYQNADGSPALNRFGVPVVREETLHTRQAEVLGPLYLPLHILSIGGSLLTGGGTHDNNPVERGPERGVTPWPWK